MRRGLALLLFGCFIATAWAGSCSSSSSSEEDEEDDNGDGGYFGQRVDDASFRLERIEARLNAIKGRLDEDDEVDHSLDVIAKLEEVEGSNCADGEFSCGGNRMCVSTLLACDGTKDCPNGADESEDRCNNRARAGESFTGRIHWVGCKANGDSDMTIAVTGNMVYNYFPSRVWIDTRTTFDYGNEAHSYDSSGSLDFGSNSFTVSPPPGEHVGSKCSFITDNVLDCVLTNSAGNLCANVRLSRN